MFFTEIYTSAWMAKVIWKVCPCGKTFPSLDKRVVWHSERCRRKHKSTLGGRSFTQELRHLLRLLYV